MEKKKSTYSSLEKVIIISFLLFTFGNLLTFFSPSIQSNDLINKITQNEITTSLLQLSLIRTIITSIGVYITLISIFFLVGGLIMHYHNKIEKKREWVLLLKINAVKYSIILIIVLAFWLIRGLPTIEYPLCSIGQPCTKLLGIMPVSSLFQSDKIVLINWVGMVIETLMLSLASLILIYYTQKLTKEKKEVRYIKKAYNNKR